MRKTALIVRGSVRRFLPLLAVVCLMALSSSAFAQTPPAFDLGDVMTDASGEMKSTLAIVVPIAFGLLAIGLGIRYGSKKLKDALKNS